MAMSSFREFVPRHRGRHLAHAHINDDYAHGTHDMRADGPGVCGLVEFG